MKVARITKGRTNKVVTFSHVTEVNDEAVFEAALVAAGETRGSLFGHTVTYYMDDDPVVSAAVVNLYTD